MQITIKSKITRPIKPDPAAILPITAGFCIMSDEDGTVVEVTVMVLENKVEDV